METPAVEDIAASLTCTVDRVKPNTATVEWRIRGTTYAGKTQSDETSEAGVYRLVNTYSHAFSHSDNGQQVQCVVTPQQGMGNEAQNSATVTVYCKLWCCQYI